MGVSEKRLSIVCGYKIKQFQVLVTLKTVFLRKDVQLPLKWLRSPALGIGGL